MAKSDTTATNSSAATVGFEAKLWAAADALRNNIWRKIAANESESRTLAQLRDTLLPKLISRELRVAEGATP
ncbi:hypothetical protein GC173_15415 [bacterium]|nr:hypothetical protein [bacterium]